MIGGCRIDAPAQGTGDIALDEAIANVNRTTDAAIQIALRNATHMMHGNADERGAGRCTLQRLPHGPE